jgi:Ser/Thr protein kinase RdoA (MazF antagonist)
LFQYAAGPLVARAPYDLNPDDIIARFLTGSGARQIALGSRGGFSGALLWRIETPDRHFCLKAWPAAGMPADNLRWMHSLMRRARGSGLTFVPEVMQNLHGDSCVDAFARHWDLTSWMPGTAVSRFDPAPAQLAAAGRTLAAIHNAWQDEGSTSEPCPALARRLHALADWQQLEKSGWRLPALEGKSAHLQTLLGRAWENALRWAPRLPAMLASWEKKPMPLQACVGDIWRDHVLFEGDVVAGVIDYGGVRIDHVAADLGRLMGSFVEDREAGWQTALGAYRSIRSLSWQDESLARLLDRSGAVIGLLNWIRWCGRGERTFTDQTPVEERLGELVGRIDGWQVVS